MFYFKLATSDIHIHQARLLDDFHRNLGVVLHHNRHVLTDDVPGFLHSLIVELMPHAKKVGPLSP